MKRHTLTAIISLLAGLGMLSGCQSHRALPLEARVRDITAGQTPATQVRQLLAAYSVLEDQNVISAQNQKGWARELALVRVDADGQQADEVFYVQMRSRATAPFFFKESLQFTAQVHATLEQITADTDLQAEPHAAWLRSLQEALAECGRSFPDDQLTQSLVSVGRSCLQVAALEVQKRPRQVDRFEKEEPFTYKHPEFGNTKLYLWQEGPDVFNVTIVSDATVDAVDNW